MIRFSFSTAGLYPRLTEDAVRLVKEAGFPFVEIMPQSSEEIKPEFVEKLRPVLEGIKVGSIHFPLVFFSTFYNGYPKMKDDAKRMIDDITEMGEILETEVIVIHPPFFRKELEEKISKETIYENLRYLSDRAFEKGIKIGLENSPKGGRTPEEIQDVIDEVTSSNLFPMLDTTEAVESDADPVKWLEKVDVIHIHASDHRGDEKHILPGEGDMNWYDIIGVLIRKGYKGLFTVEPLYTLLMDNPLEKMKKVCKFLHGVEDHYITR